MRLVSGKLFSSKPTTNGQAPHPQSDNTMMEINGHHTESSVQPPIFRLPPEIIQQILSHLSVEHLLSLYRTCHEFEAHASENALWLALIRPNLPSHDVLSTPCPAPTYRHLYLAHHPYWFLPRYRLWFSDDAYNGKLILVKFDPSTGNITGYRLAAERPSATPQSWIIKPSVIIHHIDPRVYVSTEDPMLNLTLSYNIDTEASIESSRTSWTPTSEIPMLIGNPAQKINASLMLTRDLPEPTVSSPSVAVWPPRTIPSMPRTRSSSGASSSNGFSAKGHKPNILSEMSETTFRLKTWSHLAAGMVSLGVRFGVGEEVSTWSTLAEDLYLPTKDKPYQGIYVGDYATHGCEFLLVLQTDQAPAHRRRSIIADDGDEGENTDTGTRHRNYISAVLAALRQRQFIDEEDEAGIYHGFDASNKEWVQATQGGEVTANVEDPEGTIHKGAIEAIKLTGDVNVPRGEHTFIADDIGPNGTIRIAHESPFRGARVVKSRGHVAARGFRDDEFIPSQLFLISPDLMAQYWLPFGHISFYKRIDIDDLLRGIGGRSGDSKEV